MVATITTEFKGNESTLTELQPFLFCSLVAATFHETLLVLFSFVFGLHLFERHLIEKSIQNVTLEKKTENVGDQAVFGQKCYSHCLLGIFYRRTFQKRQYMLQRNCTGLMNRQLRVKNS